MLLLFVVADAAALGWLPGALLETTACPAPRGVAGDAVLRGRLTRHSVLLLSAWLLCAVVCAAESLIQLPSFVGGGALGWLPGASQAMLLDAAGQGSAAAGGAEGAAGDGGAQQQRCACAGVACRRWRRPLRGGRKAIVRLNGCQCPRGRVVLSQGRLKSAAHSSGLPQTTEASTAALQKRLDLPLDEVVISRE